MAKAISLLLALLFLVSGGPAAARSQQVLTAESVDLRISTMRPLNPQPETTLRMSGTMRNRSDQQITALQVRLLLSSTPVALRSELATIVDGSPLRDGPPTLAVSEPVAVLDPGNSANWSLSIPFEQLPLSTPGVYVIGAEVIGTGADGLTQRFGLQRTFLPWYPEDSVEPVRLAWLWPVTSRPDRALDGAQLSEQTASEMASGGRLSRITGGAGDAAVTWVLDPALLQTAEDMMGGYEVLARDTIDRRAEGAGSEVATRWLADLQQAVADKPVRATAYGFPDVMALERSGMPRVITEATRLASPLTTQLLGAQVRQVLAWAPGGNLNPDARDRFRLAGANALLMSDSALPASELAYTPDGFTSWGGMPVVLADSGLTSALAMQQDNRAEALLARQRFLAEIAMTAGELPEQRSIVAAPDPLWSPRSTFLAQTLRALDQAPYARLVGLNKAAATAGPDEPITRTRTPYGPESRAAELPKQYMAELKRQRKRARKLGAILSDPASLGYDESVMRQSSALWRGDNGAAFNLQRAVSDQVATLTSQVRVATTGTFTLPGDTGRIPVTVANDLDQSVTVGIALESDEPARLSAQPIPPFEVPAGRKVSVEVEAKVVGSGNLPVKIQLVTPTGKRYGEPVIVEVRTTAYSQAAAYVVTGAFVILAFLLGMNFVRRRRARQEAE